MGYPIAVDNWDSGNTGDYYTIQNDQPAAPSNNTDSGNPFGNFLKSVFGSGGTIDKFDPMMVQRLGALGTALTAFNNASKYGDLTGKYGETVNPFGAHRARYANYLNKSYDDPTAFLNDPGHKATTDLQMNRLYSKHRALGNAGSGRLLQELADYQSQADAQYLQQERKQLGEFAGAGISPAYFADLAKTGVQGEVSQRNAALAALAAMLTPQGGTPGTNRNPVQGSGGGGYTDPVKAAWDWISKSGGGGTWLPNGVFMPNSTVPGRSTNTGYGSGSIPLTSGGGENAVGGSPTDTSNAGWGTGSIDNPNLYDPNNLEAGPDLGGLMDLGSGSGWTGGYDLMDTGTFTNVLDSFFTGGGDAY